MITCLLSSVGDALNLIQGFLTNGLQTVRVFDPVTQTYEVVGEMERGRWYPSVNVLANGDLLIVGGMQQASTLACTIDSLLWLKLCITRVVHA